MTDKTEISVRFAVPQDLFAFERLLRQAIDESDGLLPQPDAQHAQQVGLSLIHSNLVFAATEQLDDNRERVVGAIALMVKNWHWSTSVRYLETIDLFVAKDYRSRALTDGHSIAGGLIAAAKGLADTLGVPLMLSTAFTGHRIEAKSELAARMGFVAVGGNHLYLPQRRDAPVEEQAEQSAAA